jgi:uncharacterized protein YxjI
VDDQHGARAATTTDPFAPPRPPGPFGPQPGPAPDREPKKPKGRPAFGLIVVAAIGWRLGRQVIGEFAFDHWGVVGSIGIVVAGVAALVGWRAVQRRRVRKQGGVEFTPEQVRQQIVDSELGPPAFPEDGTLLGASLLAVNQHPKILEVNTTYDVFGSDARPLGAVRQVGQSKAKQVVRVLTVFDQYFTHRFEVLDAADRPVLRLTRPAKLFRTKVHVTSADGRPIGMIRQQNIFWKIRFTLVDEAGRTVGFLRADNVRAWDFKVYDLHERPVASVVKSWEGWARTAFTRADRYVVRIHEPLPHPLRELTFTAALAADLALKQDARGFG